MILITILDHNKLTSDINNLDDTHYLFTSENNLSL